MKKTKLSKINVNNIRDIDYELDKNRYGVLEYNGTRKEITRNEFFSLAKRLRSLK